MHKLICSLITTLVATPYLTGLQFTLSTADDFDKMRASYRQYIEDNNKPTIQRFIDMSYEEMLENTEQEENHGIMTYYYANIDYTDDHDRDRWPAATHVSNALYIAVAAKETKDQDKLDFAIGLTYYWVFHNYRNTNWWQNELGVLNNLGSLGLYVFDYLNDLGKSAMIGKLRQGSLYYRPSLTTHTGANLFDYADITLKSSIISKDRPELKCTVKRIADEIVYRPLGEGFQPDGSFFQHGRQLQIGSYGKCVIRLGKLLYVLSNCSYHVDQAKLEIISKYILTGLRSMTHKGFVNYSAVSREYSRVGNLNAANNNFAQFDYYTRLEGFPHSEEIKTYLSDLKSHRSNFDGMVYFDVAKMIVVNADGLYMSFKGTDSNLTNSESVNFENRLGLNLSYGTNTCVMDEGYEYYNICPIWDYAYIPGTTSFQLTNSGDEPAPKPNHIEDDPKKYDPYFTKTDENILKMTSVDYYNDALFERFLPEANNKNLYLYKSGIASDSSVSYLMQRSCHHDENNFTVTCVATNMGMVLIGADLEYTGKITKSLFENKAESRILHTTIEQCLMNVDGSIKSPPTLSNDKHTLSFGNATYKSLDEHEITLDISREHILGHWQRNKLPNLNLDDKNHDAQAGGSVMLAYIEHGEGGEGKKYKYAYSIQPTEQAENVNFTVPYNFDGEMVQEVHIYSKGINGEKEGRTVILPYADVDSYVDHSSNPTTHRLKKGEVLIIND